LYDISDSKQAAPLLGYAFDGFPIYGGYAPSDPLDINSPIVRLKSSYRLRNITERSTLPDGTVLSASLYGPPIDTHTVVLDPLNDVLILACHEALGKISSMSDYEGYFELRDAAIDLFTFYLHTFEDDYAEMINLVYSDDSDEATMDSINALLEKISVEEGEIDDRFAAAQASFSDIHGFGLLENELQEEIDGEY
jgi:hypothetical protein